MQKSFKRALSLFLAVVMIAALFTVAPFAAGAYSGTDWGTISLGETKTVSTTSEDDVALLKFVPDRDMSVYFYSTGDVDTCGYLIENSTDINNYSYYDSYGGEGDNFKIECSLTANTTYCFGAKINYGYGEITVTLEEIPIWEHDGGTITKYNGKDKNIVIPSELDGVAITSIGENILSYDIKYDVKSVTIPAGVTSIGDYAFSDCSSLKSVVIPATVTSISSSAFSNCSSLKSIDIPAAVTSIGDSAFSSCSSLESINIPAAVTSIGDYAFSYCSSLTSINIPTGITSISNSVFSGCSSLESVDIPATVTSIGESAFSGCSSLESVDIPATVTSIGDYAFSSCSNLTSVEIPNSVTSLGSSVFYCCSNLKDVKLPDTLTSIGSYAFYNCSSLEIIDIPASVTSIGSYAFYSCYSLKIITVWNNTNSLTFGSSNPFYSCNKVMLFQCYQNSAADTYAKNNTNLKTHIVYINDNAAITFDANGGTNAPEVAAVVDNHVTIPAQEPVYDNYTFCGWALTNNAATADFEPGKTYSLSSNLTLYAVWGYTINFYDDTTGTNLLSSVKLTSSRFGYFSAPTAERQNKVFIGYYKSNDEQIITRYYNRYRNLTVSDFTDCVLDLYAHWTDAPEFLGTTVSLDNVIRLNAYVDTKGLQCNYSFRDTDCEFHLEGDDRMQGVEIYSEPTETENIEKLSIEIYAKEMADTIEINMTCDGSGPITKLTSVKEYLETLAANAEAYAPDGKETELRNLCYATLKYGAAAQKQFEHYGTLSTYGTGGNVPLADENVPTEYSQTPVPELAYDEGSQADFSEFGLSYYASSMGLFADTSYAICFEQTQNNEVYVYNESGSSLESREVGTAKYYDPNTGETRENTMIAYAVSGIAAKDLLNDIPLTFNCYISGYYDDNDQWVEGYSVNKTYNFSPRTYIAKVVKKAGVTPNGYSDGITNQGDYYNTAEHQTMANLAVTVCSIYDYSVRASAYFD